MSRIFIAPYEGTFSTTDGDHDIIIGSPSTNKPLRLLELSLSQRALVGDANENYFPLRLLRLWPTVTGAGFGITEMPVDPGDSGTPPAFTGRALTLLTTTGATDVIEEFSWNIREPLLRRWERKTGPRWEEGQRLLLRMPVTVPQTMILKAHMLVEEF